MDLRIPTIGLLLVTGLAVPAAVASGPADSSYTPPPGPGGFGFTCHSDASSCPVTGGFVTDADTVSFHNDEAITVSVWVEDAGTGTTVFDQCIVPGAYTSPDWDVPTPPSASGYDVHWYYGCWAPCTGPLCIPIGLLEFNSYHLDAEPCDFNPLTGQCDCRSH